MTGGRFQVANEADFSDAVTVATVPQAPTEGALTKLSALSSASKLYRYLRYIGPDKGNCNVAEVQFYGRVADNNASGINSVNATPSNVSTINKVYDLAGRLVATHKEDWQKLEKGIYIIHGKKIVLK